MRFFDRFCPCKVEVVEQPSAFSKFVKGVLVAFGVVAGLAAVFTLVEVVLVKFFKKCNTITVQCTDLSAYEEEEEEEEDLEEEETVEEASEEAPVEE